MQSAYHARSLRVLPKLAFTITIGLITTVASYKAAAQDVYTDPVGFVQQANTASADTIQSVPFTQIDVYRGVVGSVAGNVITDANTPGWTAGQWVYENGANSNPHNTYYVIFTTGNNAGAYYTVTNNGTGSLSVDLVPTTLASVSAGDNYRIYPYWTLNTVWPNGAGLITSTVASKKTEVLFPAIGVNGINQPPAPTYFFVASGATTNWEVIGGGASNVNDQIILPDQYFIVRQGAFGPTTNVALGAVPEYPIQIPLYTDTGSQQDNYIGLYRPASQTLVQSGLSNALVYSTVASKHDEVLVLSPNGQAQNSPFNQTYYIVTATPPDSGWRLVGGGTADAGSSNVFALGTGVIVRKIATNSPPVVLWNNLQNY
jgi:uncharacterized protein (TIGR02597 family)